MSQSQTLLVSPLPSDRQPVELVREITMSLKQAERDRLLALAEEAERQADAEAEAVAQIEAALEKKLAEVAETQEALTEVCSGCNQYFAISWEF